MKKQKNNLYFKALTLKWIAKGASLITKKSAFSLTELLVVISILAALASLLMPSLRKTLHFGTRIQCAKNLSLTNVAMQLWTDDHAGQLLRMDYNNRDFQSIGDNPYQMNGLAGLVHEQYLEAGQHLYCPNVGILKEAHGIDYARIFIYEDSITNEIQANYGKTSGTLLNEFEVYNTYFLNAGRSGDHLHSNSSDSRKKSGLFKNYKSNEFTPGANGRNLPLDLNPSPSIHDVDPDTIAMVESDRGSSLKSWGGYYSDPRGFTLGLHENEGFNAAIIDGSTRWIDLSEILGDEKFSTGPANVTTTPEGFLEVYTTNTESWGTRWHWGK
jgi:prepilin-type N-terminal cleavage/methylation domain-containing protein